MKRAPQSGQRPMPQNVLRFRAIFGAVLTIVGLFFLLRVAFAPSQSKSIAIDIAFGALLLVLGIFRIVQYVRARPGA